MIAEQTDLILAQLVTERANSKLMLITSAPCFAAYRIPLEMSRALPRPFASSTRTGISFALGTSPVSPTPLPVRSPIVPATCVPWPSRSSGIALPFTKSKPGANCFVAKSGLRRKLGRLAR